ncbi:MAG: hypothetical protein EP330_29380 [Deltaproteobacteria bacterium]|nr:MAG: hypothetical protein EP330_29380 [Deltaproteobacteria bacterium]
MTGLLLLAQLAVAQDAPEDDREIIVWGDLEVERARQEVIEDFEDMGYTQVIDRDGYTLLRSDQTWKGEVRIYDDGWVRMKRQPVQLRAPKTPWADENTAGAWATCILYPFACVKTGGQLVSKRKLDAQKGRALSASEDSVGAYGDRVADRAVDEKVNALPDRLTALWEEGVPLEEGSGRLDSMDARKEAILAFWDSRTDTEWGDMIREAVEAFIKAEVQTSKFPYSEAEIARFNERRHATRELVLFAGFDE